MSEKPMYTVAVTRLHLRSLRFMPGFLVFAVRSSMQARRARGYLAGWTGREGTYGFWTATLWSDVESMRAFRNGEPHLTAMRKLLHWCDEGSYVHWPQEARELPGAELAHRRLAAEGSLSKVANPSSRHREGRTAGPTPPGPPRRLPPASGP